MTTNRLSKEQMADMYLKMVQTRRFEETAMRLFSQGLVHGTAHFCIGEEAAAVGVTSALSPEDLIYATHRGHGQSIGKGMDINRMMAEFLGKSTGFCKGKGGCMHIADISRGNLGANGIVGAQLPIATGAALSTRLQKIDRIVVCFFGDGASNEGAFHEALNLASIWKLPIIFLCVNNEYGMSMHVDKHVNVPEIAMRAAAYGMPGKRVDGNDVFAVHETVASVIAEVKADGPVLIEAKTYRIMGHSKSDNNAYRNKEDIEQWKKRCPILLMKKRLLEEQRFSEAELGELESQAAKDIENAVEFAMNSPELPIDQVADDVYCA